MIQNTFWNHFLVSSDQAPVRHRQKFRTVTISVRWRCRGRFIPAPGVPLTCRQEILMISHLLFAQKRNRYFSFLSPSARGTPAAALRRSPLGRPGIFLPVFFLSHHFRRLPFPWFQKRIGYPHGPRALRQRAAVDRPWLLKRMRAYFGAGRRARGRIRFHRKASAAKALAEFSRTQGGKNRISCGFLLESDMEKFRFIHVSWKGPTGGRKDSGYGCQRAAWMESDCSSFLIY